MIVVNNEPRIYHIAEHCTLMPGVNSPDAAAWQRAKAELPIVQHLLDDEVLEERAIEVEQIAKLAPRAALKLIKNTVDAALLKRMRKAEKRPDVLDAIAAQLEAVSPSKPGKQDEEQGEAAADESASGELEELPESGEEPEEPEEQPEPQKRTRRKRGAEE